MKAISFCPPWAQAIMDEIKEVEVRSWRPKQEDLPMRVLVHASQREMNEGLLPEYWLTKSRPFKGGVILGAVTIEDVFEFEDKAHFRGALERHWNPGDWFSPGLFGWVLSDPIKLKEPLRYKGRQRFFDVPLEGTCWEDIVNTRTDSKDPSKIVGSP